MACGCQGARARGPITQPSLADRTAVSAAVQPMYEVFNRRGEPTGRRFTSLVAAEQIAGQMGGTIRPVTS